MQIERCPWCAPAARARAPGSRWPPAPPYATCSAPALPPPGPPLSLPAVSALLPDLPVLPPQACDWRPSSTSQGRIQPTSSEAEPPQEEGDPFLWQAPALFVQHSSYFVRR